MRKAVMIKKFCYVCTVASVSAYGKLLFKYKEKS